jgi:hypothetical protein
VRILRPFLITALVAGALTALGPSAHAGSGTSTYTCTFPVLGAVSVPMAATIPEASNLPAATSVPSGSLDMDMVFTLTDSVAGLLPSISGLGISGMSIGGVPGGIPIQSPSFGTYSALDHSLPATGSNGAFTLPDPGSYPLTMPQSFDLVGTFGVTPISVPCATDAAAGLGTLTTTGTAAPGDSLTTAKLAKKRIHRGKRATVITDVTAVTPLPLPIPAFGDVVVKKRSKVIGRGSLDPTTGSVTIKTLKFKKPGRYRLKVRYLGSDLLDPSVDKVVVRVLKRR